MRKLILAALVCAVGNVFFDFACYTLSIAGRFPVAIYQFTGALGVVLHGVPPILLAIVLLNREEASGQTGL